MQDCGVDGSSVCRLGLYEEEEEDKLMADSAYVRGRSRTEIEWDGGLYELAVVCVASVPRVIGGRTWGGKVQSRRIMSAQRQTGSVEVQ